MPFRLSACCSTGSASFLLPYDTIRTLLAKVLSIPEYPPSSVLKWPVTEWYNTFRFPWFGIWGPHFWKRVIFPSFSDSSEQSFTSATKYLRVSISTLRVQCEQIIDLRDSGCIHIPSLRSWSPLYHTLPVWHFWDSSLYQTQPAWQRSLGAQRKCTSSHDEYHQRNLSIKYRQGFVSTQNSIPGEITLRWFMECGSLAVLHFAMPTKTTIMYNWFHLDLSESIKNFVYT